MKVYQRGGVTAALASKRVGDLEDSMEHANDGVITLFRLYIADETNAPEQAMLNLRSLSESHVAGRCEVETINMRQPLQTIRDGVLTTPTLFKLAPLPIRKVEGDLSDTQAVLHALGFMGKAQNDKL
jgi:circadian clock protein KaiB